jgi:hypothetical protein
MSDHISELFEEEDNQVAAEEVEIAEQTEEQNAPETAEQETEAQDEEASQAETPEAPAEEQRDSAEPEEESHKEIPLHVLRAERKGRKEEQRLREAAEAERDELRRQLQSRPQQNAGSTFDPYDDPENIARYVEDRVADAVFNERLIASHAQALKTNDRELVTTAIDWAQRESATNNRFNAMVEQQADPVSWIIQQHNAATAAEDFARDPDAFVRRRAAELGLLQQPVTAPVVIARPQPIAEKKLPASISNIPAANRTAKVTARDDEDVFSRFDR